jgi:GT2 family glycosyltransferase
MAAIIGPTTLSPTPVCSICIANYNGRGFVEKAIQSIYRQDCDFPIEIIVHDDASTDDSAEFVHVHYPDVRMLFASANSGFCASNNLMAGYARGRYLLLLNNDAELFPNALSLLHRAAGREKTPIILGLPQYNALTGELIDRGSLLDPFLNSVPNLAASQEEVALAMGACLWIPKILWQELGGFPKFLDSVAEDTYLCSAARLRGCKVKIVSGSGFKHRVGSSFGGGKVVSGRLSTTFRRRSLSEQNRTFVQALVCPSPVVFFLLPLHLISLFIEGALLALAKQEADVLHCIYLPALRSFWVSRNQITGLRREIQKNRRVSIISYFSLFTSVPYKLRMLRRHGLPAIH